MRVCVCVCVEVAVSLSRQCTVLLAWYAGFKVYLFADIVPTPAVPFAVLDLGCVCGIMITASHNPKADNGYKVYWEHSAQIIPPHDVGIAEAIDTNAAVLWCVRVCASEPRASSRARTHTRVHHRDLDVAALTADTIDPTDQIVANYFSAIKSRMCKFEGAQRRHRHATHTHTSRRAMPCS